MSKKKTHEEFLTECKNIAKSTIEVIGHYQSMNDKILVRCLVCHHEWNALPSHLLNGRGCPKCSGHHQRTQEEFIADVHKKNPEIEILGPFVNRNTPVEARCCVCGHHWSPKAGSLLQGYGCPKCSRSYKRNTQQEFEEKLSIRNPNIIVMGQYKGMKEGLQVQCRKCGHIWCSIPTRLLTGYGCRKCGREIVREKLKKTHEQFVAEMAVKNPSITILSTYSTNKERMHLSV